jgi:hypothetical protein
MHTPWRRVAALRLHTSIIRGGIIIIVSSRANSGRCGCSARAESWLAPPRVVDVLP